MHYKMSGTLTERDVKQHIALPFNVPEGATAVQIHFEYAPERVDGRLNALHLSLFDPDGSRGAGHRQGNVDGELVNHDVIISESEATPGYVAGTLLPGEWSVVIDTHMILPNTPVTYRLAIDISSEPISLHASVPIPESLPQSIGGAGWYRGDLHGHTFHSDASWEIADLLAYADEYGLDFVTLSDHNTTSGLREFHRSARSGLLTIGGIELTTYYGHALALGVRQWIDWRVRPGERTMPQIAEEVGAAGGLFIIAHPMSVGDPICTGCDWSYRDMMPGPAPAVEIWNGGEWESESNNENALALWYVWLNQGHRLVATAGTDIHGPFPKGTRLGFNVVYAKSLSERAVLEAVARGHLFVSDGPRLQFGGQSQDGITGMMGDRLPQGSLTLHASWEGCAPSDRVRLIADGQPLFEQVAGESGEQQWHLAAGQARWCVFELREANGRLRAVTNPLFIGANGE